jgi:hypothetical protein
MLHRFTPEPPRRVTVEQIAYRLVSEPKLARQTRGREPAGPRPRRGSFGFSRAFAPVAAAAAVVVIAGASAGIAVLANSHHTPPTPAGGGGTPVSSAVSSAPVSSSPSQTASTQQNTPATRLPGGPWDAELINHQMFTSAVPVSAGGSLYAYGSDARSLVRIDPATGDVVATARYNPSLVTSLPVVVGNSVWVVWSYGGGNVVLHRFDARTLAPMGSVLVPAIGAVSRFANGVLTSGPDGRLYVAAGITVAVLDPNGQLIRRIYLTAGTASSVAVSPDGGTLYVGIGSSSSLKVVVYDLASDTVVTSSTLNFDGGSGGLVATSGGVWGTSGSGMSEWTWFAPHGDVSRAVKVGEGGGGGFYSVPSYSGGVVWAGGTGNLVCASPATGKVLASAKVPNDHGDAELISSAAVVGDHAYAFHIDNNQAQQSGLIRMTPPAACSGLSS